MNLFMLLLHFEIDYNIMFGNIKLDNNEGCVINLKEGQGFTLDTSQGKISATWDEVVECIKKIERMDNMKK